MAGPNQPETLFVRWFKWSVVQLALPAMSFTLLVIGIGVTGIFASSIHSDPGLSLPLQWGLILVASGAHFVAILGLVQWQSERKRYRERTHSSSP